MKRSAVISNCTRYRYTLERLWDEGLPTCGFIMLNPSIADANIDDRTIGRCIKFAKREGCGSLIVVNLFAWRATDPKELAFVEDPRGPVNDLHLQDFFETVQGPIIAGWGANEAVEDIDYVLKLAEGRLLCLGKTKHGSPRHPLYVKGDTPLIPF
jgi:hypothetical protein